MYEQISTAAVSIKNVFIHKIFNHVHCKKISELQQDDHFHQ
jgi:hypothetical protein